MKSFSLKKISSLFVAILVIAGGAFTFAYSHHVHANSGTLTVTTLADDVDDSTCASDHCTLREAIAAANPGDTIVFASGLRGTITLAGAFNINKPLILTSL